MIAKKPIENQQQAKSSKPSNKKAQVFQLTELLKAGNKISVPPALTALTCGGQWKLTMPLSGGSLGCELHLPSGEICQHSVVLELLSVQRDLMKLVKKEETGKEVTDVIKYIAAHQGGVGTAIDKVKIAVESIRARNKNTEIFSAAIRGMTEYSAGTFDLATQTLLKFFTSQVKLVNDKISEYLVALCTKPRIAKLSDWFTDSGEVTHWFLSRIWREGQLASMNGNSNIFQLMCAGKALTLTKKEFATYGPWFEQANFSMIMDTASIWEYFSTIDEKCDFLKLPKMTEEILTTNVGLLPLILFNGDHITDYMPVKGTTLLKSYAISVPKIPGGERLSAFVSDICGRLVIGKSTRNDAVDVSRLVKLFPVIPPLRKVEVLDHFNEIIAANAAEIYQKDIFLAPDLFKDGIAPNSPEGLAANFLLEGAMPNLSLDHRSELKDRMKNTLRTSIEKFKNFDRNKELEKDFDGTVVTFRATYPDNPKHYPETHARVKEIQEAKNATSTEAKKKKSSKAKAQEIKLYPIIEKELRDVYGVTSVSQPITNVIGKLKVVPLQREAIRILHGIKSGEIMEEKHDGSSGEESSDEGYESN